MAHVGEQAQQSDRRESVPGVGHVPSSESEGWQDADVPGVHFKLLMVDAAARRSTALVRLDPGTSYPAHRHGGREECFVLSGDLIMGQHRFAAGDYQVAEEGSHHPEQSTEGGCLLLVTSSLDDVT